MDGIGAEEALPIILRPASQLAHHDLGREMFNQAKQLGQNGEMKVPAAEERRGPRPATARRAPHAYRRQRSFGTDAQHLQRLGQGPHRPEFEWIPSWQNTIRKSYTNRTKIWVEMYHAPADPSTILAV